jgi:hypothetical protein
LLLLNIKGGEIHKNILSKIAFIKKSG